jgi:hypothetical protein
MYIAVHYELRQGAFHHDLHYITELEMKKTSLLKSLVCAALWMAAQPVQAKEQCFWYPQLLEISLDRHDTAPASCRLVLQTTMVWVWEFDTQVVVNKSFNVRKAGPAVTPGKGPQWTCPDEMRDTERVTALENYRAAAESLVEEAKLRQVPICVKSNGDMRVEARPGTDDQERTLKLEL